MLKFFRRNNPELSDEELVQLYQKGGDLEHLGILYERYIELLYGTCIKFFKDNTKAEDAVMSIFEILVDKVRTHEIRQFRPWLYVLTKNHCLMALRKKDKTISFEEIPSSVRLDVVHSAGAVHPLDVFEENGEEKDLKECLEKLSENQHLCVVQFYYEGKSYNEIAEQRGETLGSVRSNIQNGRRNLRNCMESKSSRTARKKIASKK